MAFQRMIEGAHKLTNHSAPVRQFLADVSIAVGGFWAEGVREGAQNPYFSSAHRLSRSVMGPIFPN